jgi:Zn-dependent protease
MPSGRQGSIHLFRLAGVDLYLHWSWFLVALYQIQGRGGRYSSMVWSVLEYLALFAIVLTHEFGHALACRSVGGQADKILLWPFGGVAYVRPPQRPGATLWSIAAGPLVNVALAPVLWIAFKMAQSMGLAYINPDAYEFLRMVLGIDIVLFVFNMLPVYPLDGGQIFRSLLWFVMGRARSLMVATVAGFFGIAVLAVYAVYARSLWTGLICAFLAFNCWNGLQHSRALLKLARMPRRAGYACPSCKSAPLLGAHWQCSHCQQMFDTFETAAVCPRCGYDHDAAVCSDCGEVHPIGAWTVGAPHAAPGVVSASFEAK